MKIVKMIVDASPANQRKLGVISSYIRLILHILIGIIITPFIIRHLGIGDFGLYMLIGAFLGYMSLLDFGIGSAIIRYVAKYRKENDKKGEENFLGLCILISSVMSGIVLVIGWIFYLNLSTIFSDSLTNDQLNQAKIMFAFVIINVAVALPLNSASSILKALEKFVLVNFFDITRLIIRPIFIVILLLKGYGAVSIVVIDTVLNISILIIKALYVFFIVKVKINFFYFDKRLLKEIFSYSFFVFLAIIVDQIYWRMGHSLLGIYQNTVMVGIYAISMQLMMYYIQFATTISSVFLPRATQMIVQKASNEELTDLMIRTGRIQLLVLSLVFTCFVSVGKEFIGAWVGVEFVQAYYITILLMIPVTIPMIQTVGVSILQAKKMHRFRAIAYVFTAIFNVAISIPLTINYGMYGTAFGTFFSLIIGNIVIINIYYTKKVGLNIYRFFTEVVKGFVYVVPIMLIIGYFINDIQIQGWFSIIFKLSLLTILYVLLMWIIGLNKNEKNLIKSPLIKVYNKLRKIQNKESIKL